MFPVRQIGLLSLICLGLSFRSPAQDLQALRSDTDDKRRPLNYYTLAKIYADSAHAAFHLDSAYHYILEVDKAMRKLSDREKEKAREQMNPPAVRLRRDITQRALALARTTHTLAAYDHFLKVYQKADDTERTQAELWRNDLALQSLTPAAAYNEWNAVWARYGASIQAKQPQTFIQLEKNLFNVFLQENSWAEYPRFANEHPTHMYVKDGFRERYEQMRGTENPVVVEQFIAKAKNTPFELGAIDSLASKIIRTGNAAASERFVVRYTAHPRVKEVWLAWYEAFKKQRSTQLTAADLIQFKNAHPEFPFKARIDSDLTSLGSASYNAAMQSDDPKKLYQFLKLYPDDPKKDSVWLQIFALARRQNPGLAGLEKFQADYPDFPFPQKIEQARSAAIAHDYRAALNAKTKEQCLAFLEKHPTYAKPKRDSVWLRLFALHEAQATSAEDWQRFKVDYPQFPFPAKITNALADLRKGSEERAFQALSNAPSLEKHLRFLEDYPQTLRKNQLIQALDILALQSTDITIIETYLRQYPAAGKNLALLQHLLALYRQQGDPEMIEVFARRYPTFSDKNALDQARQETHTRYAQPRPISDAINTKDQNEYLPVVTTDGNTIYFCRSDRADPKEDIFVAEKKAGVWQTAKPIAELNQAFENEAPLSISVDGTEMILFVSGVIHKSQRTKTGWSKPEKLPATINRSAWQADPCITADGKAMLFASREDDNTDDINLYVSLQLPNGEWGKAISLGNQINTPQWERSPFLHPNMRTLYFSSTSHEGEGALDIFVCERIGEGWTEWTPPVNLGKTINTHGNDWGMKVSASGKTAYLSRDLNGNMDIYEVLLPEFAQVKEELPEVRGQVVDCDNRPTDARVVWLNLASGDTIQITRTDPITGDFYYITKEKTIIGYTIEKEGFLPVSGNFDTRRTQESVQLKKPIVLCSIEDLKKNPAKNFQLNNLFFETAKFDILPTSYPELDRIADIIKQNGLTVEIQGHTDNVGSEENNMILSKNRANAVRQYLIEQGCTPAKITARGFGESQPAVGNDSEEGRAQNRRVELKIK